MGNDSAEGEDSIYIPSGSLIFCLAKVSLRYHVLRPTAQMNWCDVTASFSI